MILEIKILSKEDLNTEFPDSIEYDTVKVFIKEDTISGVWVTPDLKEMHIYFSGNEVSADYNEVNYNKCLELVGHGKGINGIS